MLKKTKGFVASLVLAVLMMPVFLAQPANAVNCPQGSARGTANTLAECSIKEDNSLMPTLQIIINVALSVLGLVAVAMIIMGGFNYTTSAGDAQKVTKAKNTIMYGVIGLVIAMLAFAIVNFVLTSIFSSTAGTV